MADTSGVTSFTVVATVAPDRVIYINKDQKIVRIATNTTDLITPTVISSTDPAKVLPLSSNINDQYKQIVNSCQLPKLGVVYDQYCKPKEVKANTNSLPSVLSRISMVGRFFL